jgi:hypothetical protein
MTNKEMFMEDLYSEPKQLLPRLNNPFKKQLRNCLENNSQANFSCLRFKDSDMDSLLLQDVRVSLQIDMKGEIKRKVL